MKKFILTALVLSYSFSASAVLIQPIRSNDVEDFELSLVIAQKSLQHKKAWAKQKGSQPYAIAFRAAPAATETSELKTIETEVQKREIASFERKVNDSSLAPAPAAAAAASNKVP